VAVEVPDAVAAYGFIPFTDTNGTHHADAAGYCGAAGDAGAAPSRLRRSRDWS